jgi:hypothetical protein
MIKIRHDLIPPPTEPEQPPIKAPIKRRKPTTVGQAEKSAVVNPVVETIEIAWKNIFLLDGFSPMSRNIINEALTNTNKIMLIKNLNSGS